MDEKTCKLGCGKITTVEMEYKARQRLKSRGVVKLPQSELNEELYEEFKRMIELDYT